MTTPSGINPNLLPYLPPSYLNSQGGLAPGVTVAEATTVAQQVETDYNAIPTANGKALFLALVDDDSSQLAPTGNGEPPGKLDAMLSNLQSVATNSTFAHFMALGVNPAALATVIIELANSEETQALNNQVEDDQQAEADLEAQAGEGHAAADKTRSGAVMQLAMACVSAAISIAAMGVSLHGVGKALSGLSKIGEFGDGSADLGEDTDDLGVDDSEDYNDNDRSNPVGNNSGEGDNSDINPAPGGKYTSDTGQEGNDDPPPLRPLTRQERFKEIDWENSKSSSASQGLTGLATLSTGLGNYFNTEDQGDAQDDTADGQTDAALSQQAQATAAFAQNTVQSLESLKSQLMQYIQELISSVSEQGQSITKI